VEGDPPTEQPFLPPEPGGTEPDLGQRQRPPNQGQPPPGQGWQQPPGWSPPPGQGWQQPPGWSPAPAQPWGYAPPTPSEPDNGPAVAGFVLSMVALGLLLFSGGLSSLVSVACGALGIYYSRRGRQRVDAGETRRHRGLAQAGFISGIVGLVLSVIATAFWILILVLALTDESFRDDFQNELDESDTVSATVLLAPLAVRLLGGV
jgi:MFS family permease